MDLVILLMVIAHLHPLLDSLVESLCKPWDGVYCNMLCQILSYYCDYAWNVNVQHASVYALFPLARGWSP